MCIDTLHLLYFISFCSAITDMFDIEEDFGWNGVLMVWSLPAILAIPLWSNQLIKKQEVSSNDNDSYKINVWRSRRGWQITIFMGLQSFFFFSMAAWGPEILLRSEEHTSELQSRGQLVCRLLLERKKKQSINEMCISIQ